MKLDENESGVLKLKNTPENPLIISKKDAVTGEPIPDTVFEVRHSDGRFVGEFRTGENGMAVVTGKDVVPGWYLVTEVRANPAYIASSESKLVELKYEATAMVEFVNKPRTGLQIRKVDDVTGEPLEGVQFYISEISGATIGTYTTDAAGIINLPDREEGWVQVTEIKGREGYKPDPHTPDDRIEERQTEYFGVPQSALSYFENRQIRCGDQKAHGRGQNSPLRQIPPGDRYLFD